MSYDTTVNDAIDPPEARIGVRPRSAARSWRLVATLSIAVLLGATMFCAWALLR
jgi:hypothetical protein